MKKQLLVAILISGSAMNANAQGGLFNKIKNKVNQRADAKVDKAIDKTLDKAEGKDNAEPQSAPKETTAAASEDKTVKSYVKYDFVAGEKILYYDNFDQQTLAELPTGWNSNGSGEVTTLDKYPGNWLRLHNPFLYLTSNQAAFSENYTAEFDVILQLKNNGWMYPEFTVSLFGSGTESTTSNEFLKDITKNAAITATLLPAEFKGSKATLNSWLDKTEYFKGGIKPLEDLETWYGTPVHIAIQVQKERFRMWVNEQKLYDVPKAVPVGQQMNQLLFKVGQTNYKEHQYGVYISNIKVATGLPDTRHKLVEEGKFSTTGILFDVNSATIKAESNGVLKEIAEVLKKYPEIKVMVLGHTDADGNDKANQTLSEQRAASVKEYLRSNFEISAERISTGGKGESLPVADNKTKEGKAANRRVEFIKQ